MSPAEFIRCAEGLLIIFFFLEEEAGCWVLFFFVVFESEFDEVFDEGAAFFSFAESFDFSVEF